MVFSSSTFLFLFFPVTFLGYFVIDPKYRNAWLCILSMIFYAWGGFRAFFLICCSVLVNFIIAYKMGEKGEHTPFQRKICLILAVVYNLGILGFFKYYNFIAQIVLDLLSIVDSGINITPISVALPIGISFFTFQILSYVIDVYWGNVKPQKSLLKLDLYIMLFPQLIAGPIVRYIDVERQINEREVSFIRVHDGLKRFVIGLGKKVIISNNMALLADFAFNNPADLTMSSAWIGAIGYTFQIYYDFSGYSDMAIGMGKMLGFDFLENFNYPYIAKSVKEFWRRWHISLSTWFRDYVYIPLGGSRGSAGKTYRNLLVVFFLTGLWHGASWNFIVWGMFHGIFLVVERLGFGNILKKMPLILQHGYTLLVAVVGWVFFRAEDLPAAIHYLKVMFDLNFDNFMRAFYLFDNEIIVTFLAAILFSAPVYKRIHLQEGRLKEIASGISTCILFTASVFYIVGSDFNPFIYFIF